LNHFNQPYKATCVIQRGVALLLALQIFLSCVSCSRSPDDRIPVITVQGKVFVDDQPAEHARVVFHPQDAAQRLVPHGRVDREGAFQLSTYELNDGAPVGEYAITITWTEPAPPGSAPDAPEGPNKLDRRYADPQTSTLRVRIEPSTNQLEPFLIK
jgi:hypothetical protein